MKKSNLAPITSGILKGMGLVSPNSLKTRPTGVKQRQALMNTLRFRANGASVWDFFAGSGAVGIELVSEGASSLVSFEQDTKTHMLLEKNQKNAVERLKILNLETQPKLSADRLDLMKNTSLEKLSTFAAPDIIFADPPYDLISEWLPIAYPHISLLLASDGIFILECPKEDLNRYLLLEKQIQPDNSKDTCSQKLKIEKYKTYGNSAFIYWERGDEQ